MPTAEQQAILTIALLAAFADGSGDDREREAIKGIAASLAGEFDAPQLTRLYQDVLLKRVDLRQAAAALTDHSQRQLAYEMAVCVCDADGAPNAAERMFLDQLKVALSLDATQAGAIDREASALVEAPLAAATLPQTAAPAPSDADLDQYIFNHSIVNGAIELLPQSLASMAIIPLQMKMVYRIGQRYGHDLDRNHIKEFIATAGIGITSQYLEQFGRKLLGGLLGSVAGGLGRGLGSVATGAAFSFATTYALGHLAKRYYAGGRQMNTALLQSTYQSLLGDARQLQQQNIGLIREKARTLDASQIMSMVRN
ncbi:YcjF family protein [Povalibacter sp.]|uniref:YcjF family protein n=1 Tax=Povalibacter sp. TaxID=1962978 RepID=UPI002F408E98